MLFFSTTTIVTLLSYLLLSIVTLWVINKIPHDFRVQKYFLGAFFIVLYGLLFLSNLQVSEKKVCETVTYDFENRTVDRKECYIEERYVSGEIIKTQVNNR